MSQTVDPQTGGGLYELSVLAQADNIVVIGLQGEFDLTNTVEIMEQAERVLSSGCHVIFDLDQITFIDSTVLSTFLRIKRRANETGSVIVIQLAPAALADHLFALTDIEHAIPRAHSRIDAVRMIYRVIDSAA